MLFRALFEITRSASMNLCEGAVALTLRYKKVFSMQGKTLSFGLKLQTSEQEKEDVYKKYYFSGSGEVTMDYREFGPPLHLFLEGLLQDFYLMIMGKKSLITLQSLFCSSSCGY